MRAIRASVLTAGVAGGFLAAILAIVAGAARPQTPSEPHDISKPIQFELGGSKLRDGDRITIEKIRGTASDISPGHLYEISGTYKLQSHDQARLEVEQTSNDPTHYSHMATQDMVVNKGEGHFTVYMYIWSPAYPHMSFYPMERGESFASVYFGTGESVLRHASWLDDPK